MHAVGAWDVHGVSGCRPALPTRPPRFDHGLPRVLRLLRRAPAPARHAGDVGSVAGQAARPAHVGRSAGAEPEQLPAPSARDLGWAGPRPGGARHGRARRHPRPSGHPAIRAFCRRVAPGRTRRRDREARRALPRRLARAVFGTIKRGHRRRPHRLRVKGMEREACHGAWPERSLAPSNGASPRPHRLRVKGIEREASSGAGPRVSTRQAGQPVPRLVLSPVRVKDRSADAIPGDARTIKRAGPAPASR